jgi:predicted transcriptional regulator
MIARELISSTFPTLICSDVGKKALNIMESFRVSEIPLVRDKEYLGLISDKNIYDFNLNKSCIGEKKIALASPYVLVNQHIFEVIQKMLELNITVLPVLELNMDYAGAILQHDLSKKFLELVSVTEQGAVLVLELNQYDYVLSQITQIIESNGAKILSIYTRNNENTKIMEVTIKINITDISSIIQTFVRYDYTIKAVYMDDSLITNMYNERFDLLMKYINI